MVEAGNIEAAVDGMSESSARDIIAQAWDNWQTKHEGAIGIGWVRHELIADAYKDEPRGEASWWLDQVTPWGQAVDPFVMTFWSLVDQATLDGRFCPEGLAEALSRRSYEDIASFQRVFDQLHRLAYDEDRQDDLWKAGRWYGRGLCSPDSFNYFVCGLVFCGETTYRGILQHPQRLLTVDPTEDLGHEEYRNLARVAFDRKAEREGHELDFWDYIDK